VPGDVGHREKRHKWKGGRRRRGNVRGVRVEK